MQNLIDGNPLRASSIPHTPCACGSDRDSGRRLKTAVHPEDISGVMAMAIVVANLWGFLLVCGWIGRAENLFSTEALIVGAAYLNILYLSCHHLRNYLKNLVIVGGENAGVRKRG